MERQGELITLKVCANGFLYNMARAMAGTVVYAAEGKIRPEEIGEILASGNRTAAGPTVPAGGLYMTRLWYDDGIEKFEVGSDDHSNYDALMDKIIEKVIVLKKVFPEYIAQF